MVCLFDYLAGVLIGCFGWLSGSLIGLLVCSVDGLFVCGLIGCAFDLLNGYCRF